MMARALAISGLASFGLGACAAQPQAPASHVVERLRIDETLVNILVETSGAGAEVRIDDYTTCVASKYALDQGFGFLRPIRINRTDSGGIWRADAVYSITPWLPRGPRTIDADIAVQNCAELGIPTG